MRDRGHIQLFRRPGFEECVRRLPVGQDYLIIRYVWNCRTTIICRAALQVVVGLIEVLVEHLLVCENPVVIGDWIGFSDKGAPLVRICILDVLPDYMGAHLRMFVEPAVQYLTVRRYTPPAQTA